MVRRGLVDEVRRLLEMGYGREVPSMSGIGYAEIAAYLAGELDQPTAVARIKTGTHRLARHQNSWFKESDPRIRWLTAGEGMFAEAERVVEKFLREAAPTGRAR
jgi:tRNA dimethylallyltransferase